MTVKIQRWKKEQRKLDWNDTVVRTRLVYNEGRFRSALLVNSNDTQACGSGRMGPSRISSASAPVVLCLRHLLAQHDSASVSEGRDESVNRDICTLTTEGKLIRQAVLHVEKRRTTAYLIEEDGIQGKHQEENRT